jgi:hypothetical protein
MKSQAISTTASQFSNLRIHSSKSVTFLIPLVGQNRPWVLGYLFYKRVKFERGENWSHKKQAFRFLFFICHSMKEKLLLGLKNIAGAFAHIPPPPRPTKLRLCIEAKDKMLIICADIAMEISVSRKRCTQHKNGWTFENGLLPASFIFFLSLKNPFGF